MLLCSGNFISITWLPFGSRITIIVINRLLDLNMSGKNHSKEHLVFKEKRKQIKQSCTVESAHVNRSVVRGDSFISLLNLYGFPLNSSHVDVKESMLKVFGRFA